MIIRTATPDDALAMSTVLTDIIAVTQRNRPSDPEFVLSNYITNPHDIRCSVAVDENGDVLGFQALILATEGNQYGVAIGWGVIGTHISPRAARRGVGSTLFKVTKEAAMEAGLQNIDATIGEHNDGGLAYYESIGFRTYRTGQGTICKRFILSPAIAQN